MIKITAGPNGETVSINPGAIATMEDAKPESGFKTIVRTQVLVISDKGIISQGFGARETREEIEAMIKAEYDKHHLESAITNATIHKEFLKGWLETVKKEFPWMNPTGGAQ